MNALSERPFFRVIPCLTHSIRVGRALILLWAFAAHGATDAELKYSKEFNSCADKSGGVTVDLRTCTNAELQRQDQRLNSAYQKLTQTLQPASKKKLKAAQLAWIQFRDAQCELESANAGDGTLSSLMADSCHLEMTARRANELEAFLKGS